MGHMVMILTVVADSRHAVAMDVRRRVTPAARTRTMTSFPAMDHVVETRAQRLAASAAGLVISPSGIQSAMKPSAGVQSQRARMVSARTHREIISIVAAVQRHAVGMGARLPAMFAAQTQTTTNSHAMAHAAGMRVLRRAASAVNLGRSKNGILSATRQNAGVPSTEAPTT